MAKRKFVGDGLVKDWRFDANDEDLTSEDCAEIRQEIEDVRSGAARERLAADLRQVVKAAGLNAPTAASSEDEWEEWELRLNSFSEGSLERLSFDWLTTFEKVMLCHDRLKVEGYHEEIVLELIYFAAELGQLEKQMWWRTLPIPGTETKASPGGKTPEELSLERLSLHAQNRGQQGRTKERQDFLRQICAGEDNWTYEALANHAVKAHPSKVEELWGSNGEKAERQIVSFLKNHGRT